MKKIKLNKKGFIEDFGSLVLAGVLIFIIGVVLIFLIRSDIEEKKAKISQGLSELEGTYSTRVILNYELESGYTLAEFIVDKINEKKYDEIKPKISEVLHTYYGGKNTGDWFFRIKYEDHIYNQGTIVEKTDDSSWRPLPNEAIIGMPPAVLLPNKEGNDVEVLIKKILPTDYEYKPDLN